MERRQVALFVPFMEEEKVSEVARAEGGFLHSYLNNKPMTPELALRRYKFISRTLPAYNKNPTYRRFLSLVAWAYLPKKQFPPL